MPDKSRTRDLTNAKRRPNKRLTEAGGPEGRGAGAKAVPISRRVFSPNMNTRPNTSEYKRAMREYCEAIQSTEAYKVAMGAVMNDLLFHGTSVIDCNKLSSDTIAELKAKASPLFE